MSFNAQTYSDAPFLLRSLVSLQIGVFLAENGRFPPAVEVVAQCAGADQTEFVEFAHMVKPDCYIVHSYSLFLILLLTLYP